MYNKNVVFKLSKSTGFFPRITKLDEQFLF